MKAVLLLGGKNLDGCCSIEVDKIHYKNHLGMSGGVSKFILVNTFFEGTRHGFGLYLLQLERVILR